MLREIDKLDKIGADEVAVLLTETCGATEAQARACLELAELTASDGAELAAESMRCARLTASSRIPRPTRWLVRDSIPWP